MIILTLGIYFFIWAYKTNNEMKPEYTQGPNSILLIILFFIPLVDWFVTLKFFNHIKKYQEILNYPKKINVFGMFLIAFFLTPLACALIQNSLNKK